MSDLQRKLIGKSLPLGLPPKLGSQSSRGGRGRLGGGLARKSYKGVSWKQYWTSKQFVTTDSGRWGLGRQTYSSPDIMRQRTWCKVTRGWAWSWTQDGKDAGERRKRETTAVL